MTRLLLRASTIVVAATAAAVPLCGMAAADAPATAGLRSNMGLCSPYLGGLDAPVFAGESLGGNARSGVNLLIKAIGPMLPDHLDTPGELYRARAKDHPATTAEQECLPRPAVGG